jgi:hypothetical protein
MHFGVVNHIRASALTTADRRPPFNFDMLFPNMQRKIYFLRDLVFEIFTIEFRSFFDKFLKYGLCTFQSSQFFERLSMHFGVVNHIRASALTTADRRPPSWNRITDSTHAPPVGNGNNVFILSAMYPVCNL